ncbi:serine protease [Cladochytrium tenue]|nr:serine protease [Cladochytrium tenue]
MTDPGEAHATEDGPFVGKAVFKNSEEAPCHVVYSDPVNDFAIMRFDATRLKFIKLEEIPLAPERARVGIAVRIPGSDNGEKLAVLSGIIARIDRPAPNYGSGKYSDFNTFYIQASANTSGGSSGSPVIDIDGNAVALNAGGTSHAASSFFLPLERVKHALDLIIDEKSVERLGLPSDYEKAFRSKNPDLHGILGIKTIVPSSPAFERLRVGDLILSLNGERVNHHVELAEVFDSSVGSSVDLEVFRDKKVLKIEGLQVQDLFAIIPSRFLEIGETILHPLSYNLARQYLHPVSPGAPIFLADAGEIFGIAGIPHLTIITALNHKPTPTLDDFINVATTLKQGQRVPVRYYSLSKKNVELVKIILWETRWSRFRIGERKVDLPPELAPAEFLLFNTLRNDYQRLSSLAVNTLCFVGTRISFGTDGHNGRYASGVGVVVDETIGLVVADRHTNLPVQRITKSHKRLRAGDELSYVTLNANTHIPRVQSSRVKNVLVGNQYKHEIPKDLPKIQSIDIEFSEVYYSKAKILRNGEETDVEVPLSVLDGTPEKRFVHWAGLILQPPHRALYFNAKRLPKGVFIALLRLGSPAQRDGVSACWFITEVDGKRTPDLETFLQLAEGEEWRSNVSFVNSETKEWAEPEVTSKASDDDPTPPESRGSQTVRLTVESLEHVVKVLTVEVSDISRVFWPTWTTLPRLSS